MNPYSVLMVEPGKFSLEDLQDNYKRLAAQLSPRKSKLSSTDAEDILKTLTTCYKLLLNDLSARSPTKEGSSSSPFQNQKSSSMSTSTRARVVPSTSTATPTSNKQAPSSIHNRGFVKGGVSNNVSPGNEGSKKVLVSETQARDMARNMSAEKFNKVFESYRVPTAYDQGYGDWIIRNDDEDRDDAPKTCDVEDNQEPEPVSFLKNKNMNFTELGLNKVDNFGRVNEYVPRSVNYCDLRVAHSARNNMINARLLQNFKEQNKSIEDIKKERSSKESVTMTPAQKEAHKRKLDELERREKLRVAIQFEKDKETARAFNEAHMNLFGGMATPS